MLGATCAIEEGCEPGLLGAGKVECQNLEYCVTVIQRPMGVVEQAAFRKQVGETGATKTMGFPVDARRRARPVTVREERLCRSATLRSKAAEWAITMRTSATNCASAALSM